MPPRRAPTGLAGTPAPGTAGVYTLTLSAHNSSGAIASQTFFLTVLAPVPPPTPNTDPFTLPDPEASPSQGETKAQAQAPRSRLARTGGRVIRDRPRGGVGKRRRAWYGPLRAVPGRGELANSAPGSA